MSTTSHLLSITYSADGVYVVTYYFPPVTWSYFASLDAVRGHAIRIDGTSIRRYHSTMQDYLEGERDTVAMSDEDVLRASLSDPDMFMYLIRKYEAPFLRKARTVLYREEDVEDVVQETFTKI